MTMSRSSFIRGAATALLAFSLLASAQEMPPPPTWQDIMALGVAPYRQLTMEDVPVDDSAHPKSAYHIRTRIEPRYAFLYKSNAGFVFTYIQQWMIFSGLDKKGTFRKSKFKMMKAELPYAQALLDINEINARKLAALKPGELPSGRGVNLEDAKAEMEGKLKAFLERKYQQNQAEMETFAKATDNGQNKKKVRELGADIRKRLDATPATTVPFTEMGSPSETTPRPVQTPTPATPTP